MKYAVLFLVFLLPACASGQPWGGIFGKPAGEAQEPRRSDGKPQTMEPQRSTQQPARSHPGDPVPRKREHNIEED